MSEQNHGKSWNADLMIMNAKALQRVVKELEKNRSKLFPLDEWSKWNRDTEARLLLNGMFLAIPNLLSLATEIALKAWQCRERQKDPDHIHNLLELFESLEQDTQEMLEARMQKQSPCPVWAGQPRMQNLSPLEQEMLGAKMHPLRDVLRSHSDVYKRWRYLHEETSAQCELPEIDRALTVIIDAYEKRWRVLP